MERRMRETRKNRMPWGLGKTGSKTLNTPSATHNKTFQKGDRVPGQGDKNNLGSLQPSKSYAAITGN